MANYKLPAKVTESYLQSLIDQYADGMHLKDARFISKLARRGVNGEEIKLDPSERDQLLIAYAQTHHYVTQAEAAYLIRGKLEHQDNLLRTLKDLQRMPHGKKTPTQTDFLNKAASALEKDQRLPSSRVMELEEIINQLRA